MTEVYHVYKNDLFCGDLLEVNILYIL